MKRLIINQTPNSWMVRIGWFVGIWAASAAVLGIVACVLHKIILG